MCLRKKLSNLGTGNRIMNPKASVCITTYNHEKFISRALDSVLVQKTVFDFEILIGEDDSSDNTREIVKEYAQLYPDKIRLFLNDRRDVIYIDGSPTGRCNFVNNLNKAIGEYIALLDGDDYWLDEKKLQKQVDFLENNKHYSFCFADAKILIDGQHDFETVSFCKKFCKDKLKETILFDDLIFGHWVPTGSVVFRKSSLPVIPEWFLKIPMADWGLFLILLSRGPARYFDDVFSVYRVHNNSYWSKLCLEERLKKSDIFYELIRNKFGTKYKRIITKILVRNFRGKLRSGQKRTSRILILFKYLRYVFPKYMYLLGEIAWRRR